MRVLAERKSDIISTGIAGLDKMLKGGITENSQVLIAGAPGTGKSTMAFQTLYSCAKKGIPSAFVAFDERPQNVLKNIKALLPNANEIDELIRKRMLLIDGNDSASKISTNTESESGYSMGNLISEIEGIIRSIEAEIVAIDSLSFLKLMLGKTILYNKSVTAIVANLRRMNITGIFTLDVPYYERERMKYIQELLLFDGVIALYHMHEGDNEELGLEIVKMRGGDHERGLATYSIAQSGIAFKQ